MSILIKGMEMPKSCYVCPFCDYVSARCDAVKGNPYTPESRYEKRADFCPLVPVPPHGRLGDLDEIVRYKERLVVDADKIKKKIRYVVDTKYIKESPTIIPAEEGE